MSPKLQKHACIVYVFQLKSKKTVHQLFGIIGRRKLSISLTVKHIFIWDAKSEVDIKEKQKLE